MKVWNSSESEHKLNFVCSENQFWATGTAHCVLRMCILLCCGRSGLLTGNTGLIVQFIVGPLCVWPSLPAWARYVGDVGMSSQCQLKVKMQKCKRPPACSAFWDAERRRFSLCWLGSLKAPCVVMWPEPLCSSFPPLPPPDKNFEDDDSVDGGRSSSSSKGASQSGKKTVSMGSFRRPSSASSTKSAGQSRHHRMTCH